MRVLLARDSKQVRCMIFRDVQRTTIESFFRSIGDLRETDLSNRLSALKIPTLGIYGVMDNIVSPMNANLLRNEVQYAQVSMMHKSRHFPMTDEPRLFIERLNDFLSNHHEKQVANHLSE
jgi:pimeloyl-ACP methyl ester carboxylesterase